MIDEYYTWLIYGYHSDDLKPQSHKYVVVVCDVCGKYNSSQMFNYSRNSGMCNQCSKIGMRSSEEKKRKISEANKGTKRSDEAKRKMSESHTGVSLSKEHVRKRADAQRGAKRSEEFCKIISILHKGIPMPEDVKRKISATLQGIRYEDWEGFATGQLYCEKFDDMCRDNNRNKYDNRCFICDISESNNVGRDGKQRLLSVHHYDMNKDAGCDDNEWNIVPLCMRCHGKAHTPMWIARIEYLLLNVWTQPQ